VRLSVPVDGASQVAVQVGALALLGQAGGAGGGGCAALNLGQDPRLDALETQHDRQEAADRDDPQGEQQGLATARIAPKS